jgi:hypothetical protein
MVFRICAMPIGRNLPSARLVEHPFPTLCRVWCLLLVWCFCGTASAAQRQSPGTSGTPAVQEAAPEPEKSNQNGWVEFEDRLSLALQKPSDRFWAKRYPDLPSLHQTNRTSLIRGYAMVGGTFAVLLLPCEDVVSGSCFAQAGISLGLVTGSAYYFSRYRWGLHEEWQRIGSPPAEGELGRWAFRMVLLTVPFELLYIASQNYPGVAAVGFAGAATAGTASMVLTHITFARLTRLARAQGLLPAKDATPMGLYWIPPNPREGLPAGFALGRRF